MSNVNETPLSHTERARAVLSHISGIKELISGFTFSGFPDPRSLNAAKSVPDPFLESVAVAMEASERLAGTGLVLPEELRDVAAFATAFTPVADELGIMERAVRHTIAVKRASVGQLALQVYQFAKTFARKTERQVLMPHLENMKRALAARFKPKNAEQPASTPTPKPETAKS